MDLQLTRLGGIDPAAIISLMNHRSVRRHMPLAAGDFGAVECAAFVAAKEQLWREHGYGPWAFLVDGEFAGWGGLQPEDGDADLALVLHPRFWGHGAAICDRVLDEAFGTFGFGSVTILLPPSRRSAHGVARLGFRTDGETSIGDDRFLRYRLHRTDRPRR
ncbi:GNAT family N-acetyltransferase [Catellatospora vulcania]|uniref:GNAT family N-acetyltransferase n=1 Tax=Catellatospora vulcania TaxID=1460450 RepID=UPI0012D48BF5|nr:GNAT family N-acetyltransferase [Catellatospora vulcania]